MTNCNHPVTWSTWSSRPGELFKIQNVQVDLLILPRQHGLLCAADAVFGECRPFDDAVADLPRATDVQPPVVHRVKWSPADSSDSSREQRTHAPFDAAAAITWTDVSVSMLTDVTVTIVPHAFLAIPFFAITLSCVSRFLSRQPCAQLLAHQQWWWCFWSRRHSQSSNQQSQLQRANLKAPRVCSKQQGTSASKQLCGIAVEPWKSHGRIKPSVSSHNILLTWWSTTPCSGWMVAVKEAISAWCSRTSSGILHRHVWTGAGKGEGWQQRMQSP